MLSCIEISYPNQDELLDALVELIKCKSTVMIKKPVEVGSCWQKKSN